MRFTAFVPDAPGKSVIQHPAERYQQTIKRSENGWCFGAKILPWILPFFIVFCPNFALPEQK